MRSVMAALLDGRAGRLSRLARALGAMALAHASFPIDRQLSQLWVVRD